jgi:sec-independent protein translocase protein TatA
MFTIAFISGSEILIILLAVLLLFGADKMPGIAKEIGKGMKEFRRVTNDIKREFEESTEEIRNDVEEVTQDIRKNAEEANSNVRSYLNDSEIAKDLKDIDQDLKG